MGQLVCYKLLFDTKRDLLEQRIGREVKTTKYSIALLETDKYPLTSGLLETFKAILSHNKLRFGLLKINERFNEVEEVPI